MISHPAAAVARDVPQVVVRLVAPGDFAALDVLLSSLDGRDRRRRWFTGGPDVHGAARWAADPERHSVGLVATTADGQIVGHAALVPIDAARGEVCFEVAASWRHHGIAGLLLGGSTGRPRDAT